MNRGAPLCKVGLGLLKQNEVREKAKLARLAGQHDKHNAKRLTFFQGRGSQGLLSHVNKTKCPRSHNRSHPKVVTDRVFEDAIEQ